MLGSTTTTGYVRLALYRPAPFGITLRMRAIFIEYIELLYMRFFTQISCFMCMSFVCRGLPNILRSDPLGFDPPLQLSGPLANKLQDNLLQESLLSKQARYIWSLTIGQSNWLTEIAWERNYMANKHAKTLWRTPGTPNIFLYALLRTRVGTLGWTVKMPTQTWYVRACACLDVFHSGESCAKKKNKKQFCTRRMH